jgi:ornithine--oxo-acid transaminase
MPANKNNNEFIQLEESFSAHNYHPLPVVLSKGKGVYVWDVEGKQYLDFLSGYSALNQGHCHPTIINTLIEQASTLTLTSRAFHNDQYGPYAKFITEYFGYDKILPMNTGAEAVETAIKLCRKWAYEVKGINENDAVILVCSNNFHGRTSTIISFSSDAESKTNFGPFSQGFKTIPFNDTPSLEKELANNNIAGFLVEPMQGEAGVIVPDDGYLEKAKSLCEKNNVLFIADEIQTGLGRTGKRLACDYENVHPDILILGKALSGGTMPISAVLASNEIMLTIKPGQHGSTFGGNPLASAIAKTAIEVIEKEKMTENAFKMGKIFRNGIIAIKSKYISVVRGKGLMNAIEITHSNKNAAQELCLELMRNGLLAKPTHGDKIRFTPPLTINEKQMEEAIDIIENSLVCLDNL